MLDKMITKVAVTVDVTLETRSYPNGPQPWPNAVGGLLWLVGQANGVRFAEQAMLTSREW